jgi:hypothetical protein
VTTIAARLGWFQWVNGAYRKGRHYETFLSIMDAFESSEPDLLEIAAFFNSVLLCSWLTLLFYPQGGGLRLFYLLGGAGFYLMHVFNLFFLREVKSNLGFFQEIRQEIDQEIVSSVLHYPNA